jgi:hypothetical protein
VERIVGTITIEIGALMLLDAYVVAVGTATKGVGSLDANEACRLRVSSVSAIAARGAHRL